MIKNLCKFSFVLFLSCFLLNCDTDQNAVFDAALDRLEPELEATEDVNDRIALLEKFRVSYDGHPKIGTIRARIDALKATQEKVRVEKEKLGNDPIDLKEKIEKGAFDAMASFALSAIAQRSKKDASDIEMVRLPGFNTVHEFENPAAYTSPSRVRSLVLRSMYKTDKNWMRRCDAKCQNLYASKVLKTALGEDLFNPDGRMNPVGVEKLLGLLEGDSFGQVKYTDLIKVYGPSIRRMLQVREAIRKIGDKKLMTEFTAQKTQELKGLPKWYRKTSKENADLSALSQRKFPIARTFGFWIRRMDDKTADSIEVFLNKHMVNEPIKTK